MIILYISVSFLGSTIEHTQSVGVPLGGAMPEVDSSQPARDPRKSEPLGVRLPDPADETGGEINV
jgi:hypothetical protein